MMAEDDVCIGASCCFLMLFACWIVYSSMKKNKKAKAIQTDAYWNHYYRNYWENEYKPANNEKSDFHNIRSKKEKRSIDPVEEAVKTTTLSKPRKISKQRPWIWETEDIPDAEILEHKDENTEVVADHEVKKSDEINLPEGSEESLDEKFENIISALNDGHYNDAIKILIAYIDLIIARTGNEITEDEAEDLVTEAEWILDYI